MQIEVQRQPHRLEINILLRLRFIRRTIAKKGIKPGEQLCCLILWQRRIFAGDADQIGQVIGSLEKDLERFGIYLEPPCAHLIQDGFIAMRKADQPFQAEGPRTAFDGMHRAEDNVDGLWIIIPVFHRLQTVLQRFKKLFAFNEE